MITQGESLSAPLTTNYVMQASTLRSTGSSVLIAVKPSLNHLYGGYHEPELKIIDGFVANPRKKLVQATGGQHYIETVWGRGYAFRDPTDPPALQESSVPWTTRCESASSRDPPRFQSICLNRRLESSLGGVPIGADRDPAMRANKQAE